MFLEYVSQKKFRLSTERGVIRAVRHFLHDRKLQIRERFSGLLGQSGDSRSDTARGGRDLPGHGLRAGQQLAQAAALLVHGDLAEGLGHEPAQVPEYGNVAGV